MVDLELMQWAEGEFAGLELGHKWRTARWLKMAAGALANPSGRITECFKVSAERQAAYKLLEGDSLRLKQLVASAARAALCRSTGPYVVAPIDQCTLSLSAANAAKSFGRSGRSKHHRFGAESMHSIALSSTGVPLGLLAQTLWARTSAPRQKTQSTRLLPLAQKETRHWVEVATNAHQAWLEHGLAAPLWFQLDAGGDAREVLSQLFAFRDSWVTVRCRQDRRVTWPEKEMLGQTLARQTASGRMKLAVSAGPMRQARTAVLEVRWTPVLLRLKHPWTGTVKEVQCYAVSTQETETCPLGEEPLSWVLLTTKPVSSFEAAKEVVKAYALRWRIEEVHRTWKTGGGVEESGLSFKAFQVWAGLLLCVAVRTERLKRLSREEPELPAEQEFSPEEIEALKLLSPRAKKRSDPNAEVKLGEAVLWVAELGGFMGPTPSRGPPGSIVIQRGLDKLAPYVDAFRLIRDSRK